MFDTEQTDFAVAGDRGFDLFTRVHDSGQKRAQFRCFAMVSGSDRRITGFEPLARRDPDTLLGLVDAAQGDPLLNCKLALGDTRGWPCAEAGQSPLRLLLYLDFFRAWQVADMAAARLDAQMRTAPDSLPALPAQLAGAVAPVYAFNRLDRGVGLARLMEPILRRRIETPGFADDPPGSTGYALRMLGDLCLRAGEPAQALACFETAVAAGDNPHRRRKAIEAAHAAGLQDRVQAHAAAYAPHGRLPDDLAALTESARQ
tara:strand:+ start:1592 stop:2368 length:777 start_codon:yes stop_codon:yes gene_type:complete